MQPKQILVLGGGFAGLWSAVGAARKLDEMKIGPDRAQVMLVDRNPYHSIRVRNYEQALDDTIIPLADVLDPIGVRHVEAEVEAIDVKAQTVGVREGGAPVTLAYDRLVIAFGSRLFRPDIPGLAAHTFDVDTYAAGATLNAHIDALARRPPSEGRNTVLVIGAGFTGIEVATEMPDKLRCVFGTERFRVILADVHPVIGQDIGAAARPVIEQALSALGIETKLGVTVTAVTPQGVTLASGEFVPAETVVWCAGMRANPLTALVPVEHDRLGRIPVDAFMRVKGIDHVFAAGDCAWCVMEPGHASVMSCQHGRPMGRFAGHNVAADLLGAPLLPLAIDWYVTVIDLGDWGALYTVGWDRQVLTTGAAAKETKKIINRARIYPPRTRDRDAILAAAAPVVQIPPAEVRAAQDSTLHAYAARPLPARGRGARRIRRSAVRPIR